MIIADRVVLLAALCLAAGRMASDPVLAPGADSHLTPEDLAAIPVAALVKEPYVIRKDALLINLGRVQMPGDWLKIPGVKGAWKNFGQRGKTVLQDADGDGQYELYGESAGIWCRLPDGTVRWNTKTRRSCQDNNGLQCEDLDGDGKHEVVSVGDFLTVLDARTGKAKLEREIVGDFTAPSGAGPVRLDYPYRLGRCSDKRRRDVVVANGYSPRPTPRRPDGKPSFPRGGIQIICYRCDGTIAWRYRHVNPGYGGGGHEIRVQDIDGDGWDETIHSASGGVVCLNHDGTERWRHDLRGHSDWIEIVDMDGRGAFDVVVEHSGDFYVLDADKGTVRRKIADEPRSHVQCFAAGKFRGDLPGLQLAVTTIGGCMLRIIDGPAGRYLPLAPGTADAHLRKWNGLDMYNCSRHDADGDGQDEVFTFTTPKGGQLQAVGREPQPTNTSDALQVGVAAFKGDGRLAHYWNFYTPAESGIRWGARGWEMRQFTSPVRRFDVDGNGIEEAYLETSAWILLLEIPLR